MTDPVTLQCAELQSVCFEQDRIKLCMSGPDFIPTRLSTLSYGWRERRSSGLCLRDVA